MSLFSIIKRNSKKALSNNWGAAMAVMLIPSLASFALSMFIGVIAFSFMSSASFSTGALASGGIVDLFYSGNTSQMIIMLVTMAVYLLISLFVLSPLSMGATYWNLQLVKAQPKPVMSIFYFFEKFKRYRRSVWMTISIMVRQLIWSIILYAVPVSMTVGINLITTRIGSAFDASTPAHYRVLLYMGNFLTIVVFIAAALLCLAMMNKYNLAIYFLCEDSELTAGKAIKKSIEYTKGYRFSYLWFTLSFIGWMILTAVFFPVALYTGPYYSAAFALYSLYIIETKKREQPVVVDQPVDQDGHLSPEIINVPENTNITEDEPVDSWTVPIEQPEEEKKEDDMEI